MEDGEPTNATLVTLVPEAAGISSLGRDIGHMSAWATCGGSSWRHSFSSIMELRRDPFTPSATMRFPRRRAGEQMKVYQTRRLRIPSNFERSGNFKLLPGVSDGAEAKVGRRLVASYILPPSCRCSMKVSESRNARRFGQRRPVDLPRSAPMLLQKHGATFPAVTLRAPQSRSGDRVPQVRLADRPRRRAC